MKVYVDELPKSCKDCFFCEHIKEDIDDKGRDEVACYFEGFLNNVLLGETFNAKNCKHLQSLADYTKQVRKEVCDGLALPLIKHFQKDAEFTVEEICKWIEEYKDQIQGETSEK